MTYEHRFYPKETDTTGSITLTGNKATYNYTLRPANITNFPGQLILAIIINPAQLITVIISGMAMVLDIIELMMELKGAITGLPSGNYLHLGYMTENTSYTQGTIQLHRH